jgi:hypothetical protein
MRLLPASKRAVVIRSYSSLVPMKVDVPVPPRLVARDKQ